MKETKNCPHCGKEILAVARKCKHCRMWIDQVTPPHSEPGPAARPVPETSDTDLHHVFHTVDAFREKQANHNRKFWGGMGVGAAAVLLIALIVHFSAGEEKLYLMDIMQPNTDYSYYVGVATNDFQDRLAMGKGWCGDFQIVVYKPGARPGKFQRILSGSQLEANIFNPRPSGKYSSLVYFSGTKYDDFEPFYGKVDVLTGKYDIFEGELIGLIAGGSYKDCYLAWRGDKLMVFPQSPVGESYDPILTFDPAEYFGGADLYDLDDRTRILNWIETQ